MMIEALHGSVSFTILAGMMRCVFFLVLYFMLHTSVAQIVSLSGTYIDSLPPSATCTYLVNGNVTLQGNFHLRGLKFLCKSDVRRDKNLPPRVLGANIRLCNAHITLENCTFASADSGMWGGIYLADSSSKLTLLQTEIRDSYHGIMQADSLSQIIAKHSWFYDNYVSLQLAGKRDTVRYCVFTSKPSRMKMPFDSVATNDYYYSFAHVRNTLNRKMYFRNKNILLNLFYNSIYGIFANEKHLIQVQGNYFAEQKLAAIFHQNGDLHLTDTNEIYLPRPYENTLQMQQERQKYNLPDSATYGIYANNCHDELSHDNLISAEKPAQAIGYYGFNTNLNLSQNMIENCKTGVFLNGNTGTYTITQNRFNNNATAIRINRSIAGAIALTMTCNDFISARSNAAPAAPSYPARTALRLTGSGYIRGINGNHVIGGCNGQIRNGITLTSTPNGNEIRNAPWSPTNPNITLPANYTFINNQLSGYASVTPKLIYYRYDNENVGDVPSSRVSITNCITAIPADINACRRTQTGVATRQGQGEDKPNISQTVLGKCIPNPANHRGVTIEYTLPEGMEHANIVLRNSLGVVVYTSEALQANENSIYIPTAHLAAGFYTYSLAIEGRPVQTLTMMVVK